MRCAEIVGFCEPEKYIALFVEYREAYDNSFT